MTDRLISEREAIDEIYSYRVNPDQVISEHPDDVFQYNKGLISAIQIIKSLPTAQPQRMRGRWEDVNGDGSLFRCNICNSLVCCAQNNFCPNCGADMKEEDE